MGSRAARRKSQRRLRRRPGTAWRRHGWRAQLPQRRTCSRDPPSKKSRGLAQDQVLVLEPLHLALEAQHLGFIRFLLGQRLSRASRKLLIAPLAQLARAHIQLRSDVGEWQATLDQALNRLGLILAGEPPPGSFLGHSILLGGLGSLQNPPRHRGKPTDAGDPLCTDWTIAPSANRRSQCGSPETYAVHPEQASPYSWQSEPD